MKELESELKPLESIYAFVCSREDREEIFVISEQGTVIPLVFGNKEGADEFKPLVQHMVQVHNIQVDLCKFSQKEVCKTYKKTILEMS